MRFSSLVVALCAVLADFPGFAQQTYDFGLENVDLSDVIHEYSKASNRTILHPDLPRIKITSRITAPDTNTLATKLQQSLQDHGISVILDGPKFALCVPTNMAGTTLSRASTITPASTDPSQTYQFNFSNLPLSQAVEEYARISKKQLDKTDIDRLNAQWKTITVQTRTSLTRTEAIYLLDRLLEWQHVKIELVGTNSIKPVLF